MLFPLNFLEQLFPENKGVLTGDISIDEVTTDSRKKTVNSLFIPLVGDSFDGHVFLKEAYNNGAIATLWQRDRELPDFLPEDFPVLFVRDSLEALQQLAHHYRLLVNPIVIGVTGSNGKTTTKDLIGTVLQGHFKTHRTKGNFNNHIGLPLTILSMDRDTEVLVLEMGMNHFGEIELLSLIAEPNYAVITNIGESHIEFLGSREGIAQAKTEIAAGLQKDGVLFVDGDEPLLYRLHDKENVVTVGFEVKNRVVVKGYEMSYNKTIFWLEEDEYQLNMLGKHNVKNAAFAIKIAQELKVPGLKVKESLVNTELTGMRFEKTTGKNGVTIINDAYNASPTSMKASIEVVKQMKGYERKVLVLGDMFEMGKDSKALHRSVAEVITNEIDAVYTIGEDSREISKQVAKLSNAIQIKHFISKDLLLEELEHVLSSETILLLKGSRGMKLETLLEHLTD